MDRGGMKRCDGSVYNVRLSRRVGNPIIQL